MEQCPNVSFFDRKSSWQGWTRFALSHPYLKNRQRIQLQSGSTFGCLQAAGGRLEVVRCPYMSLELWISQVLSFEACQLQTLGRDSHSVRRQPSFMDGLWRPGVDIWRIFDMIFVLHFELSWDDLQLWFNARTVSCRWCVLRSVVWSMMLKGCGVRDMGQFVWCNQSWWFIVLNFSRVVSVDSRSAKLAAGPLARRKDLHHCGLDEHFVSSRRVDESSLCTRTLNGMGQALDLTGTTPEVP